MILIEKVKVTKEGVVKVQYSQERADGLKDSFVLESHDKPLPEFERAFVGLPAHVVMICELPAGYAQGMTVTGVSWSTHEESGTRGAVMTAQKKLATANSPLVLNTPHLPYEAYSGQPGDPNPVLPVPAVRDLERLEKAATAYVKGERAQGELGLLVGTGDSEAGDTADVEAGAAKGSGNPAAPSGRGVKAKTPPKPDRPTSLAGTRKKPAGMEAALDKALLPGGVTEDLLLQARAIILETRRASTSSLQRRLKLGYTVAARLMDVLEERGVVGPTNPAELTREILI